MGLLGILGTWAAWGWWHPGDGGTLGTRLPGDRVLGAMGSLGTGHLGAHRGAEGKLRHEARGSDSEQPDPLLPGDLSAATHSQGGPGAMWVLERGAGARFGSAGGPGEGAEPLG